MNDAVEVIAQAFERELKHRGMAPAPGEPEMVARAALSALEAAGFTLLRRPPPQTAAAPLVSAEVTYRYDAASNEVRKFVRGVPTND